MKPVMQTIVDADRGDCHRATIASLLEVEIEQVPHFRLFDDDVWWNILYFFLWGCGYELHGTGYLHSHRSPADYANLHGLVDAAVPSSTFPDKTHSVIMNVDGLIVHDPNPNQAWAGKNVIESGELDSWSLIGKRPRHGRRGLFDGRRGLFVNPQGLRRIPRNYILHSANHPWEPRLQQPPTPAYMAETLRTS